MERIFTNAPGGELTVWEKIGEEEVLAGRHGLKLISQKFRDPRSQPDKPKDDDYTRGKKGNGVTVIPVLSDGKFVITRQFKQGDNMIFWEFPAGMTVDSPTAEPEAELKEESGLEAGKIVYLGSLPYYPAPRKWETLEHMFVAFDCKPLERGPQPRPDEIIEVYVVSLEELWGIMRLNRGPVSGFSETAFFRAVDREHIRHIKRS